MSQKINLDNFILFEKIVIRNFMSFGEQETEFDLLNHPGLNYIYGRNNDLPNTKNGAGKSNLFNAILYALFGRITSEVNKPNIVNRVIGKDCYVCLTFKVNEERWKIVSTIKPTAVNVYLEDSTGNWLDRTQSSIKETVSFIANEVIHCTYEVFKNIVLMSITGNVSIYQMQKYQKRDFVEKSFTLSIIGLMYKTVKDDINKLDKEISTNQSVFIKLEKDLKNFDLQLSSFEKDKNEKVSKLRESISKYQEALNNLKLDDSEYTEKKSIITEKLKTAKNQKSLLEEKKNKIQEVVRLHKKDISNNELICKKYDGIFEILCEECTKEVNEKFSLDQVKNTIALKTSEVEKLNSNYTKILETLEKLESIIKKLETEDWSLENNIKLIFQDKQKQATFQAKIDSLGEQIKEETGKISPFEELISKYKKEKDEVYSNLKERMERKKYLDYIVYMLSEDGVKKFIISNIVNIWNGRIRKYLDELSANYTVILSPDFNATFLTSSGECEYGNFSSGEQKRIEIATSLGLRDVMFSQGALKTNLLICDEILDSSLCETAVNNLIKILRREAEKGTSVYLISHRECIDSSDFERVICIEKTNGFTNIVEEGK